VPPSPVPTVPDREGAPTAALRLPDFRRYQLARLLSIVGFHMQSVAVGWQLYSTTGRALDLGLVGLAQFLPFTLCVLPAGQAADRFDRKLLLTASYLLHAVLSAALVLATLYRLPLWSLYAILGGVGAARALGAPAASALTPHLVPAAVLPNAIAWTSTTRQIGVLTGPALGGLLYGAVQAAWPVYRASALASALAAVLALRMHVRPGRMEPRAVSLRTVLAGFEYVWRKRLLLGTFSLDLFAVLLGGATALLPIYAKDILHVGPLGLGLLRSAPAVGAGVTAVLLAHHPLERRAGKKMLGCVFLFGVATVVFGLSRSFALSLLALALLGATDMVSVVVRLTLEQLATPPEMRGRVSAVNMMFIGASNELGDFESGLVAAWIGAVPAVVLGGVGTCLVVVVWSRLFPEMRDVDELRSAHAIRG